MSTQLSGYLPGDHGLEPLEVKLIDRFEHAYAAGDREPVSVVVVGVLDVASVRHRADPENHPPVLAVRFAALEVAEGRRADQLRQVLVSLRSTRNGTLALDGMDEALAELLTNETGDSTASRDPKTGPLAKPPAPPAAFRDATVVEGPWDDPAEQSRAARQRSDDLDDDADEPDDPDGGG